MRKTSYILFIYAFLAVSISECSRKQDSVQQRSSSGQGLPSGNVTYTVPSGWIEEAPASQMRSAQFRWPGAEGKEDAVLAVFFFPGTGGSVEANLSRWYRQFKQPDGRLTHELAQTKKATINGIPVTVTYVTGTFLRSQANMMMGGGTEEEELPNYAMLAAIAETSAGPWFFKATGSQKTIDHWRKSFDDFVKTFQIQRVSS
jgi:hypothetical protein